VLVFAGLELQDEALLSEDLHLEDYSLQDEVHSRLLGRGAAAPGWPAASACIHALPSRAVPMPCAHGHRPHTP